jgi:hypothetical protein
VSEIYERVRRKKPMKKTKSKPRKPRIPTFRGCGDLSFYWGGPYIQMVYKKDTWVAGFDAKEARRLARFLNQGADYLEAKR